MQIVEKLITDEQLEEVFENTNFGTTPKREVIRDTLLKHILGHSPGYTANQIAIRLGLLKDSYMLTSAGREYLMAACSGTKESAAWRDRNDLPKNSGKYFAMQENGSHRIFYFDSVSMLWQWEEGKVDIHADLKFIWLDVAAVTSIQQIKKRLEQLYELLPAADDNDYDPGAIISNVREAISDILYAHFKK